MQVNSDYYYTIAFPGILFLIFGLYSLNTRIFTINIKNFRTNHIVLESTLKNLVRISIIFGLLRVFVPGEIAFIFYLISILSYVGVYSLMLLDKKHIKWLVLVLSIELIQSLRFGMFHDFLMWTFFSGILITYVFKLTSYQRILGVFVGVLLLIFIQNFKSNYRNAIWYGGKSFGLETIVDQASIVIDDGITSDEDQVNTLTRLNQGWIFASVIKNMDRTENFQGLYILKIYLESALLPRILAPNKLRSGEKHIFNEFSGHTINKSTSMGLGIFSDGFIAYGTQGVWLFGYFFGLFFSFVFKLVESWSRYSKFYILILFPILCYAIRPDCELQTILNHLVKSIILYSILVHLTKFNFSVVSNKVQL